MSVSVDEYSHTVPSAHPAPEAGLHGCPSGFQQEVSSPGGRAADPVGEGAGAASAGAGASTTVVEQATCPAVSTSDTPRVGTNQRIISEMLQHERCKSNVARIISPRPPEGAHAALGSAGPLLSPPPMLGVLSFQALLVLDAVPRPRARIEALLADGLAGSFAQTIRAVLELR
jgi:hypothetical protein